MPLEVVIKEHVIFEIEKFEKFIVITAYKTSKINKYWKEER